MKTATLSILLATMMACQRPAPKVDASPVATGEEGATESEADVVQFPSNDLACDSSGVEAVKKWMTAYYEWQDTAMDADGAYDLVHVESEWDTVTLDRRPFMVHVAPTLVRLNSVEVKLTCGDGETEPKPEPGRIGVVKVDCLADEYPTAIARSKREAQLLGVAWEQPEIVLSVAVDTPWSRVVEAVELMAEVGVRPAYLAFYGTWPAELEPPPEALLQEIRAHFSLGDDHAESPRPARGEGCVALTDFMDEMSSMPPEQRSDIVAARLGEVWVECKCETDIEWQVGLLGGAGKPVVLVEKQWDAGGTNVSHPAAAKWADIASAVVKANSPIAGQAD